MTSSGVQGRSTARYAMPPPDQNAGRNPCRVSVVIPTLNEQLTIAEVLSAIPGTCTTIASLTSSICDILSAKPLTSFTGSSWIGDVTQGLCADTSKLSARFGWKPRITLREGLGKTVEWFRSTQTCKLGLKVEV